MIVAEAVSMIRHVVGRIASVFFSLTPSRHTQKFNAESHIPHVTRDETGVPVPLSKCLGAPSTSIFHIVLKELHTIANAVS